MSTNVRNEQRDHDVSTGLLVPLLAIAGMLSMLNIAILGPLMPEISRDLSVSFPVLGQITAAVFFGSACVGLLAGPLSDQFGRKRLIVFGLLIVAVSTTGSALAPSFEWLFAARLIGAISGGMMAGTTMAIAGTLFDGLERRRAIGTIASGMAAAPIVGIPTLTLLASTFSWRFSLLAYGVTALLFAGAAQRVVPSDHVRHTGRIDLGKVLAAYLPLVGDRSMLRLFGASLGRAIGWMGLLTYIGAYWNTRHGLSVRDIGWTAMLLGVSYFAGTKLGGGRLAGINARSLFGVTTLLCGSSFGIAIAIAGDVVIAMGFLLIAAITGGIGFVALTALVSTETPAGQGTTMSLNAAIFALGSAIGSTTGGVLLATGGYEALGLGLMGFMLLSAFVVWRPARLRFPAYRRSATGN